VMRGGGKTADQPVRLFDRAASPPNASPFVSPAITALARSSIQSQKPSASVLRILSIVNPIHSRLRLNAYGSPSASDNDL
jgi:hypothetical protein